MGWVDDRLSVSEVLVVPNIPDSCQHLWDTGEQPLQKNLNLMMFSSSEAFGQACG